MSKSETTAANARTRFAKLSAGEAVFVVGEQVVSAVDHDALDLLDRGQLELAVEAHHVVALRPGHADAHGHGRALGVDGEHLLAFGEGDLVHRPLRLLPGEVDVACRAHLDPVAQGVPGSGPEHDAHRLLAAGARGHGHGDDGRQRPRRPRPGTGADDGLGHERGTVA